MYDIRNNESGSAKRKYYHWELLKRKYKPVQKSIIQTCSQSEKVFEKKIEATRRLKIRTILVAK